MKKIIPTLLLTIASFPVIVHAASCDKLRSNINNASDLLNKAQQAKSFNDAKRGMNSAKYAMNDVAEDARSCPCAEAADLFDDAATKIRLARDADATGRFNDYVKQGIERFGAAIDALNACPASQQKSQDLNSTTNVLPD